MARPLLVSAAVLVILAACSGKSRPPEDGSRGYLAGFQIGQLWSVVARTVPCEHTMRGDTLADTVKALGLDPDPAAQAAWRKAAIPRLAAVFETGFATGWMGAPEQYVLCRPDETTRLHFARDTLFKIVRSQPFEDPDFMGLWRLIADSVSTLMGGRPDSVMMVDREHLSDSVGTWLNITWPIVGQPALIRGGSVGRNWGDSSIITLQITGCVVDRVLDCRGTGRRER